MLDYASRCIVLWCNFRCSLRLRVLERYVEYVDHGHYARVVFSRGNAGGVGGTYFCSGSHPVETGNINQF